MVQLLVEGGEPDRNLGRAVEWIGKAAGEGCQIALLPEVLDLGWTHPSAKNEAEPIPGPRSELLCGAAQKNAVYVCAGLTEKEGNKVFNTALLIDESGTIILKYRKINVLAVAQEFYAIGNHLSVVETPLGVIGVDICSDNYRDSPEIGSVLARMGAQLILSPSAWTSDYHYVENQDPYGEKWFAPYHRIAKYFNVVMVGCTSVGYIVGGPYEGKKMIGCSIAVNQAGLVTMGRYNEFATELVISDIELPSRPEKGTEIGEMLTRKGYYGS